MGIGRQYLAWYAVGNGKPMMAYYMTDNFRAWLAELSDAEVTEFAAKLDMPVLLQIAAAQRDASPLSQ